MSAKRLAFGDVLPLSDSTAIISLQERSAEIDADLSESVAVLERTKQTVALLPHLPVDCWQIIIELALDRRTLSRWDASHRPTETRWMPRSKTRALEATENLHNFRTVCHGFRNRIDACVVEMLVLPTRHVPIAWQAYVMQTKFMIEQFRRVHTVVISADHGNAWPSKAIAEAVPAAVDMLRDRMGTSATPLVISDLPSSPCSFVDCKNAASIGPGLKFQYTMGEYFGNYEYTSRTLAGMTQCVCIADLRSVPNIWAQAVWLDHFGVDTADDETRSRCLSRLPVLRQACTHLYVRFPFTIAQGDLQFAAWSQVCKSFPRLRELHLVGPMMGSMAFDLFCRWRREVAQRYQIFVHIARSKTSTEPKPCVPTMYSRFHDSGLLRYLSFDAEDLIESAKRVRRFM